MTDLKFKKRISERLTVSTRPDNPDFERWMLYPWGLVDSYENAAWPAFAEEVALMDVPHWFHIVDPSIMESDIPWWTLIEDYWAFTECLGHTDYPTVRSPEIIRPDVYPIELLRDLTELVYDHFWFGKPYPWLHAVLHFQCANFGHACMEDIHFGIMKPGETYDDGFPGLEMFLCVSRYDILCWWDRYIYNIFRDNYDIRKQALYLCKKYNINERYAPLESWANTVNTGRAGL